MLLTYDQFRDILTPLQKPCAFLHMESFEQNISTLLELAGDKNIRIASKSIRSVEAMRIILQTSKQFQGIMCYSAAEAIYLYDEGFDDLLIAYPTWDERSLKRICKLIQVGATITLMLDSIEHVEHLETIALEANGHFLVAIDFDLSSSFPGLHFGVYRSPINTVEAVMNLIKRIQASPYLKLDGMMGYEAQIAGVADASPKQLIKNSMIRLLKRQSKKHIRKKRIELMKAFKSEGISLRFMNGGGTGSLQYTVQEDLVTEVTVGSGFYNPHLFDKYKEFSLSPAVGYAIEITRRPREHIYTCAGGGYVASGAVGIDKLPEIYLPKGATFVDQEGVGEVQTPIVYKGPETLNYGDPIILRHSKAGEICERFQSLYVIENGEISRELSTYRGDGFCFL